MRETAVEELCGILPSAFLLFRVVYVTSGVVVALSGVA